MRRTLLLVAGWAALGVISVGAATFGVSMVGDQVTAERPTPLSADQVRDGLADGADATTTAPADETPPSPAPEGELRTYPLVGGTASLRFGPAGVTVVAATPEPGFAVKTERAHGNGVRVQFESDRHRSRITGWWDGGLRDEVDEDDR